MVASDRVSAFDVVLPQPVPRKGEVLTLISAWWFGQTEHISPNHLISIDPDRIIELYPQLEETRDVWARRAMLAQRLDPIPVECVVRGYIAGSAWKEYAAGGTLAGESLTQGLEESARLDPPLFSPATKAEEGHDENITIAQAKEKLGEETVTYLHDTSIALYRYARDVAETVGLIIADTKFEFGFEEDGSIILMDEVLTPDSSRFWPADQYQPGRGQPSFDKQPVRDYLEALVHRGQWNRQAPGPDLPDAEIQETTSRYLNAFRRLTGTDLDDVDLSSWGQEK